jgi:hypothetical protein
MTACFSGVRLRLRSEGVKVFLQERQRHGKVPLRLVPNLITSFLLAQCGHVKVTMSARRPKAADHHPDIDICFSKVTLALSTHDSCGVTEKDFALAAEADRLAAGPAT